MISCDAVCCIAGAFALMLLPLEWLLSAWAAALIHECGHLLGVILCGGKLRGIRIRITGCEMETGPMPLWQSVLSILAGPAGSFLLLALRRRFPLMAVCGLLQGLYNMMPVLPLDGGRVLFLLLKRNFPEKADWIMGIWENLTAMTVLCLGIWLYLRAKGGICVPVCCLVFNIRILLRKIPCKHNRIGLQWY